MRRFSSLVVAEQFGGSFGNFRNVVTAALQFKEPVHVLVPGGAPEAFVEAVKSTKGVDKVLVAKHDRLENP
jgi:electron transfer flavoprotein alpha subunit